MPAPRGTATKVEEVMTDAPAHAKLPADQTRGGAAALAAANARIAELEAAMEVQSTLGIAPVPVQESASYYVTAVGVCYAVDGAPTNIALGLHGQVITLVDSEAERLLLQNAVRAASEADIANEVLRAARSSAAVDAQSVGPAGNPYGGTIQGTTLEAHAAEQIKLAKKSGALPADAIAPGVIA